MDKYAVCSLVVKPLTVNQLSWVQVPPSCPLTHPRMHISFNSKYKFSEFIYCVSILVIQTDRVAPEKMYSTSFRLNNLENIINFIRKNISIKESSNGQDSRL